MKQETNLFGKMMPKIKEATWYRQRFDACPHFMFFLGDAHISEIQHTKYPFGQKIAYGGFSKNRADWYHNLEDLEDTANQIIKESKKNPKISSEMIKEFKKWEEEFYEKCLKIKGMNLKELDNGGLLKVYFDLADIYTKKLAASPLIDGFALATDTLISLKVQKFLEQKNKGDEFVKYFSILTAPTFLSFLQLEEIEFLEIAKEMQENSAEKDKKLKEHQEKYFWIQNNYVKDNVLDFDFFKNRLKEFDNVDLGKKI